jgi:TolB-like protein/Tfp pilus assembly protein PilF/class 3 adenylate cyclase
MSSESSADVKFEIGHVLFIDIVGYSKLLINEQSERIQELREIVRGTEQFRRAEAEGKLMRLPTGDGGALVFRTSAEAPVLCALQIAKALKTHPELRVRMGIHSGPVNEVADFNEQVNMAGDGVNVAQRVMDCGDAGHILLSKRAAEDLGQYRQWQPQLHDLGDCKVKHGERLHVFNLFTAELGNPKAPTKFRQLVEKWPRTRIAALTLFAAAAILAGGLFLLARFSGPKLAIAPPVAAPSVSPLAPASIPDKSIAVLPLENLSRDPDNAYFAEGMQDEILARLSKIADLKVISRTSTLKYKSAPDNLREIAKELGVANIVEGSVQKAADQVRVNVQLINALNDAHLWADIYDRKLTDIFAVESEIAKAIADTLQAKLTGSEKQLIAAQPTSDTNAYELYLKGRLLWGKRGGENIRQAIAFYEQAIARDPNYALAYSGLAEAYDVLPFYSGTAPREAYPKAKTAALKALQLNDKLAEAHSALAYLLCVDDLDMSGSIREFQRAIALNPNYATAHQWYGFAPLNVLGRFDEAIAEGRRAVELDPLSPIINENLSETLIRARRYDEAIAQLHKTLEIDPSFSLLHLRLGTVLQLKGDMPAAIAEYTKAQQLSDDLSAPVLLAAARAQSGDKEAAAQMLTELEELSRHRYVRSYWRALLCLSLGYRDEAIQWLEQSIANREGPQINFIKVDPTWDPLRDDPRFEKIVASLAPKQ